jgi:predicted DNA binding CopG/RHH family protein
MSNENLVERKTVNATLRMSAQDWDALREKAEQMGLNRTKFLTQIARGEIRLEKGILIEDKQILGESLAG